MGRFLSLAAALLLALAAMVLLQEPAGAAKIADIRNTKHNLSVTGPGTLKATSETQVCVFCHTPHEAQAIPAAPLWNRKLSAATYTTYTSSSIDASAAELAAGPGGSSKLCLSCHDGTMAIGNVNVLNQQRNVSVAMTGTGAGGTMVTGSGATTGFTRDIGVNLTNDHPISFTYDAALAAADGELRGPDGTNVGTRTPGVKPKLPLEKGQIQCATCHDPHLRETDSTKGPAKFLRLNRFQEQTPTGGAFSDTGDIICLACHDKAGQTWALSAHANPQVATEIFTVAAGNQREFPANQPVWKAACLNCHDTHTVEGARRLLREGTDSLASPKAGGSSAIEETCYQCHSALGTSVLTNVATVPNIKDDFSLARHMPIKTSDQQAGAEVHDIGTGGVAQGGKDFVESPTLLGLGASTNRHVECTDCHNPHRVIKNRLFNGNASVPDAAGTHNHAAGHTNVASGVLKGGTGVEPTYAAANFGTVPSFTLKRGDGGVGASSSTGSPWVTREYQVCLKCHSTYAFSTPPNLGDSGGGTPSGTNGLTKFSDTSMEAQAPAGHKGETSTSDSGAFSGSIRVGCGATATCAVTPGCTCYNVNYQSANHRGWHPVLDNTGRSLTTRAITSNATNVWRAPWNGTADVGSQTMYCTDCHGSDTGASDVVPVGGENGSPWGPHGSTNNFILKGEWSATTGANDSGGGFTANALCFKCHNPTNYATKDGLGSVSNQTSGFYNSGRGNLHAYHTDKIGHIRCTWCHVAVPHGWKNKALLVNLNDVGPEVGLAPGTQVRLKTTAVYNNPPYYLNAALKVRNFKTSGNWVDTDCGSAGAPGNGVSGKNWMNGSSEQCVNLP
jgi:hypothetical protein